MHFWAKRPIKHVSGYRNDEDWAVYSNVSLVSFESSISFVGGLRYNVATPEHDMNITADRIQLTNDQATLFKDASRLMSEALDRSRALTLALVDDGEGGDVTRINVPPSTLKVLARLLSLMADQQTFLLSPADTELTTGQAADMLGVSRPFLVSRLEAGDLAFRKVGRHRRLRLDDVLAYQRSMQRARAGAMDDLVAASEEIGGYTL